MLVAGASLGLVAPIAATANEVTINDFNPAEELAVTNSRVDGLEARLNNFEAGGFSDTTTLDGKAVFALMGTDHSKTKTDGTDSLSAAYQYTMNLNTSFTGDDNLYVRLRSGNSTSNFVNKEFGTYLSMGTEYGLSLIHISEPTRR